MNAPTVSKRAAIALTVSGIYFLLGAMLHPHAPDAHTMAEVAYTQTGQLAWWPAHVLLTLSYITFALFTYQVARHLDLPRSTKRLMAAIFPIASLCVVAMTVHLLLPLGRHSVSNGHDGWALWVKDVVESADAVWALCLAATAWGLGRAGVVGTRHTAIVGSLGGLGFGIFSLLVPLTNVVIPMHAMHEVIHFVPVFAILTAAWAISSGLIALRRNRDVAPSHAERPPYRARREPMQPAAFAAERASADGATPLA